MTTTKKIIGWMIAALVILPATIPVLIILGIYEGLNDPSIYGDKAKYEEILYKALKISLVPVSILGVISIKALGIYMVVGFIIGILTLPYIIKNK